MLISVDSLMPIKEVPITLDLILIEAIEDSPFQVFDQADLLLVCVGLKPASWLTIESASSWRQGEEPRPICGHVIAEATAALDGTGLPYETGQRVFDLDGDLTRGRPRCMGIADFFVGGTQAQLDRAVAAIASDDDRERGLALGIPETAVEAVVAGTQIRREEELPTEVRGTPGLAFMAFMPSRDHWRDELAVSIRRAEAVRKESPTIYEAITG